MAQVTKVGHIGLKTGDVEGMLHHYTEVLGLTLTERGEDGTAYLSCGVDHHAVALYPGTETGLQHVGLQLAGDQPLDEAAKQLRNGGLEVRPKTDPEPGISESIEIDDPEGNSVQLYSAIDLTDKGYAEAGVVPHKLGHVALTVHDVAATADFYQEQLGFRWSDWIADFFVFLRCGPDHHSMNFIRTENPTTRMHHVAFELRDWSHVHQAGDTLAKNDVPIIWGPSRHGVGHNIFTYHRDPDGNVVELFTELDIMLDEGLGYFEPRPWHQDFPQRPKVWTEIPLATSPWGSHPPEEMMD